MPKLGSLHKSRYWRAADLDEPIALTITQWSEEELGEAKEPTHVLSFQEDPRGLTINRTREHQLLEILGEQIDLDELPGKRIQLVPGKTTFRGKVVGCINLAAADEVPPF